MEHFAQVYHNNYNIFSHIYFYDIIIIYQVFLENRLRLTQKYISKFILSQYKHNNSFRALYICIMNFHFSFTYQHFFTFRKGDLHDKSIITLVKLVIVK